MSQCYEFNFTSGQPQLLPNVWVPCPVGNNCCIGIDTCMSNNLCYYGGNPMSKEKRTWVGSGYYNARCTDPTYTDPACDKTCINFPPDMVYNYTLERWACCGNNTAGEVTCDDPVPEYYEAPAPESLVTLKVGAEYIVTETLTPDPQNAAFQASTAISGYRPSTSTSVSSSPTSTSSASISSVTNTTPASSSADTPMATSGGLSVGAKAGIGVGVALGVIALLATATVAFRLLRSRRKAKTKSQAGNLLSEMSDSTNRQVIYETDSRQVPAELNTQDENAYFSWQPSLARSENRTAS